MGTETKDYPPDSLWAKFNNWSDDRKRAFIRGFGAFMERSFAIENMDLPAADVAQSTADMLGVKLIPP